MSESGYHYTRDGHKPSNMLNLSKEKQKALMAWRVKQILANDPNTTKKHITEREDKYMTERIKLEGLLRGVAKKKLGEVVEHPLYFRTDKADVAWGDKVSPEERYEIHPDLLAKATYHRGDSFDLLRKSKSDPELLKTLVKNTVLTQQELKDADKRKLKMLKRKHGNYTEGQLWAPYDIEGNNIVPKKENKDMNNINKIANLTNRFSTNHSVKIMSNLKKQAEEKESNSKRAHDLAKYLRSHRLPAEVRRARSTDSHYIKSTQDIRLSDHKANKNNKALDGDKLSKEKVLELLQVSKLDKAALELDLKIGDIVLGGRYKNKRETVKSLETDELGQPMYNGKKLLTLRIEKKLPKNKWSSKSKELNREGKLYKAAKLVIAKKKIYNI